MSCRPSAIIGYRMLTTKIAEPTSYPRVLSHMLLLQRQLAGKECVAESCVGLYTSPMFNAWNEVAHVLLLPNLLSQGSLSHTHSGGEKRGLLGRSVAVTASCREPEGREELLREEYWLEFKVWQRDKTQKNINLSLKSGNGIKPIAHIYSGG